MEHYNTLGVAQGASPADIKTAFRKLASQNHPDKGGDTAAFQRIQTAYSILSDPIKREQYDQTLFFNNNNHNPFQDLINQFTRHHAQQRIYTVTVVLTLEQIAKGGSENIQISTPYGPKMFNIQLPPAVDDGGQFNFQGIMPDGLVSITFRVAPHHKFRRQGIDLYCTENISVFDLILGSTLSTYDIMGNEIEVTIPPMTKPDSKLRIKSRGLNNNISVGDQYVLINPIIPDIISSSLLVSLQKEVNNQNE